MRYIIMADGRGKRWKNFTGQSKHLIKIKHETLLERLVRQLRTFDEDCDILITAKDECHEVKGAIRHRPLNNKDEIDRFTAELINDQVCFLYGDTYYTDDALVGIIKTVGTKLLFFGDEKRIIAVKVFDGSCMKKHVEAVKRVNPNGKGWHLYQAYTGLELYEIGHDFVVVEDKTQDFNTPEDYLGFINEKSVLE